MRPSANETKQFLHSMLEGTKEQVQTKLNRTKQQYFKAFFDTPEG
jgi:hypothetical protein